MKRSAIYPGSFDPLTFGHLDIIERATHMFKRVIVTVAVNRKKNSLFKVDERMELIKQCLADKPWAHKVEIDKFSGLLVRYAEQREAHTLIRGIRQVTDFEYEFSMALTNRQLNKDIDTIFLMPDEGLTYVSASLVREVAYWDGDISHFVPKIVQEALREKFKKVREAEAARNN